MQDLQRIKSCDSCEHLKQHYVISHLGFTAAQCYHCTEHLLSKKDCRELNFKNDCELWEPIELTESERNRRIEVKLRKMADDINQIVSLLKIDNDKSE